MSEQLIDHEMTIEINPGRDTSKRFPPTLHGYVKEKKKRKKRHEPMNFEK